MDFHIHQKSVVNRFVLSPAIRTVSADVQNYNNAALKCTILSSTFIEDQSVVFISLVSMYEKRCLLRNFSNSIKRHSTVNVENRKKSHR